MRNSSTQRLLSITLKPLLAAVALTVFFRYIYPSKPREQRRSSNPHPHLTKALIIASTSASNLSWLSPELLSKTHWIPQLYITDAVSTGPSQLTVPVNKGNEAMVYLTYIIDNYDFLPDVMFFHHHHEQAWHQSFPSPYELTRLKPDTVVKQGYVSPRCLPGCENVIEFSGDVAPMADLATAARDVQLASLLREFYRDEKTGERLPLPKKIAAPCCAQFAVSKQKVRERGLDTWKKLREWLIETDVQGDHAGRLLEWTWHLWFGMEDML